MQFEKLNLQDHKHAATVIEGARDGNFGGRIVEIETAQLVYVREQIVAA